MEKVYNFDLAGKNLNVNIGKMAGQANGSCLLTYGDTMILVTATASKEPRAGIDFFPLSVDYVEKSYSVGKIPGGFIKREGRPSEQAVLNSRLIDRPLRPLFPEGYRNDVQIIASVLSVDPDCSPEIIAMIGSSIALSISDIPFAGPTASVLVGLVDGEYIINPNNEQRENSKMHLVVSGTENAIMMVEAGADIINEKEVLEGILFAQDSIKEICKFIKDIQEDIGKEKMEVKLHLPSDDIVKKVETIGKDDLVNAMRIVDKTKRNEALDLAKAKIHESLDEEYPEEISFISDSIDAIIGEEFRRLITKDKIRPDGRKFDEIRQLTSNAGLIPRTHGSGMFTRGETQVLTLLTLGSSSDVQVVDDLGEEDSKRYIHHYNFPPFSVGDTRPMRSPGRREIGHGALAEKALLPVIPSEEEFPYTIRLVSEVLSSNGSSSQASVCGSTLALMDGGVPIKAPVAGIAMGLIKEDDDISILTDIQGLEDHLGDMDFKVAGTKEGITAIQMDIKIDGIDKRVLEDALEKARLARLQILDNITDTISEPRAELSKYAPLIFIINIKPEKIGEVIGGGGKTINKIIETTDVKIDIEDDGKIFIVAEDKKSADKAIAMIEEITKEAQVGEVYNAKVVKIMNFGAFVELFKGTEGLLHISQISTKRINKVEDVLKVGDRIEVKVTGIDDQGKISLSHKALIKDREKEMESKK
ncbi:MAG: polyribonucleotide nucleotidyltransferase [Tissierellia bacterium]|nr:polyribonucleotide nucleotidyltransferase [Tissierellia bacterium]